MQNELEMMSDAADVARQTEATEQGTAPELSEIPPEPIEQAADEEPVENTESVESAANADELAALRDEITSLRAELESRDRALERMYGELSEFSELYPDRVLTALPNEVWEGVRSGLPLSAAVALYEARCRRREAIAAEVNRRNSAASSGSIDGADVEFYSPDEVRSMNAAEVRQNYSKILDSMKLWS